MVLYLHTNSSITRKCTFHVKLQVPFKGSIVFRRNVNFIIVNGLIGIQYQVTLSINAREAFKKLVQYYIIVVCIDAFTLIYLNR